jgi:hypothetical protein
VRGRGPSPFQGAPKSSRPERGGDPFFPPGLRQFATLAVSPSSSVALRLCGEMGTPHPIKPALGSLRSSENWQQRGIREFFNSLLDNLAELNRIIAFASGQNVRQNDKLSAKLDQSPSEQELLGLRHSTLGIEVESHDDRNRCPI